MVSQGPAPWTCSGRISKANLLGRSFLGRCRPEPGRGLHRHRRSPGGSAQPDRSAPAGWSWASCSPARPPTSPRRSRRRPTPATASSSSSPAYTTPCADRRNCGSTNSSSIGTRRGGCGLTDEHRDFGKPVKALPLLSSPDLRMIAVVKKNVSRLTNLRDWLREAQKHGGLDTCPILIIDDEADQASPNAARNPELDRTRINRAADRTAELPRVAYVGYTATPFANVLVNPADADGHLSADASSTRSRSRRPTSGRGNSSDSRSPRTRPRLTTSRTT